MQVNLDAAFALMFREVMDGNSGPIYLWCDSSPQGGVDWLLSIFDYVLDSELPKCFQHVQKMFASVDTLHSLVLQSEPEPSGALPEQVAEALQQIGLHRLVAGKFLTQAIRRHRQMPMGLGSGASSLEYKCQALAIKFLHESSSFAALRAIGRRVYSLTVDMGVEVGVADAKGGDLVSYLPPWMSALDSIRPDSGLDALCHESDHHFLPNALLSAGLDHIANNLLSDMDQALTCWNEWLVGFKALSHLLSHKHLLVRLIARCIDGTPFQPLARMFETCVEPVAKWRWGTIVKTLPSILKLQNGLHLVWDEGKFLNRGESLQDEDGSDVFKLAIVTKTVKSSRWWAFGHMLLHLHAVGNFPSAWGSGCRCHEWMLSEGSHPQTVLQQAMLDCQKCLDEDAERWDGPKFQCPLKGKRAPELAANALLPLVRAKAERAKGDILLASGMVDEADREAILNDFGLGVSHILMTLELKLGHWQTLPWLIAGLALPENNQQLAQKILAEFDKLPAEPIHHHKVSWKMLRPGCIVRQQVEAVATGACLADQPQLLLEVSKASLVPVVERIVEGAHSLVHRHSGYRKVSGAYVSCAQRLGEIDKLFETKEGKMNLVQAFESLRKPRALIKAFRLQDHPRWLDLTSKPPTQQTGIRKVCNAIVYSTDSGTMYTDHRSERKRHDQHNLEEAAARKKVQPAPKLALTADSVMQCALSKHVCEKLEPGCFYSVEGAAVDKSYWPRPLKESLALQDQTRDGVAEEENDGVQRPNFFKVVSAKASNLKTVKAPRRRLARSDVVVTVHEFEQVLRNQICVNSQPLGSTHSGDPVHVLGTLGLGLEKVKQIRKWTRCSRCRYTLPHFNSYVAATILDQLFECKAMEGTGAVFMTDDPTNRRVLQEMAHEGLVLSMNNGWQLSRSGAQQLQVGQVVDRAVPICDAGSGLPLQDLTAWQLLQKLVEVGWEWRKFVTKARPEPYRLGLPRVWYTSTVNVSREYLLCLLSSDTLLLADNAEAARCELHHGMKVVYYQKMLDGDFDGALQILNSSRPEQLEDKPVVRERPMLADEGILWERPAQPMLALPATSDARPVVTRRRKRKSPPSEVPTDDSESDVVESFGEWVSDAESAAQIDHPQGPTEGVEQGGGNSEGLPSGGPASSSAARAGSDEALDDGGTSRVIQPETLQEWGAGKQRFRITWRKPSSACAYGAWQGTCPYHLKKDKVRCTKALNVTDESEAARDACLQKVQHWLVSALSFDRASKHAAFNPRLEETPPSAVLLERSRGMNPPDGPVVSDVVLDASAEAVPSGGKAKGRGQRQKAPKAKAKSKAKSKAAAAVSVASEPNDANDDVSAAGEQCEDSSSSSSSSSSSAASSSSSSD